MLLYLYNRPTCWLVKIISLNKISNIWTSGPNNFYEFSDNGNCLGYRPGPDKPYQWISYQEVGVFGALGEAKWVLDWIRSQNPPAHLMEHLEFDWTVFPMNLIWSYLGLKFLNFDELIFESRTCLPVLDEALWLMNVFKQVLDRSQNFGSGLIAKGAETTPEQRIGIYSQNRVEWSIAERACNCFSMAVVPLYDTLGPQAMRWIVQQCKLLLLVLTDIIYIPL